MTFGVDAYTSEAYLRAERDKLWCKVWLQVGRVEDLPEVGSYLTYDILDDSIIVVRTGPDSYKAFYNVCTHRGRKLIDTPPAATQAVVQRRTQASRVGKELVGKFRARWSANTLR